MCVEGAREGMGTCTCVCGGDQGGDGDMYMCVWRGPGRGWGHVHVCVEGDQGGDRDMYMLVRFTGDPQQIK